MWIYLCSWIENWHLVTGFHIENKTFISRRTINPRQRATKGVSLWNTLFPLMLLWQTDAFKNVFSLLLWLCIWKSKCITKTKEAHLYALSFTRKFSSWARKRYGCLQTRVFASHHQKLSATESSNLSGQPLEARLIARTNWAPTDFSQYFSPVKPKRADAIRLRSHRVRTVSQHK